MDWAVDGRSAATIAALRREIVAYLRRHGEPDSDLAGAEMVIAELLSNAFEHAPGPAWVSATWETERPRLEVHDLGPGFSLDPTLPEPDIERGRGLFIANAIAGDLARAGKAAGGSAVSATLPGVASSIKQLLAGADLRSCEEQRAAERAAQVGRLRALVDVMQSE